MKKLSLRVVLVSILLLLMIMLSIPQIAESVSQHKMRSECRRLSYLMSMFSSRATLTPVHESPKESINLMRDGVLAMRSLQQEKEIPEDISKYLDGLGERELGELLAHKVICSAAKSVIDIEKRFDTVDEVSVVRAWARPVSNMAIIYITKATKLLESEQFEEALVYLVASDSIAVMLRNDKYPLTLYARNIEARITSLFKSYPMLLGYERGMSLLSSLTDDKRMTRAIPQSIESLLYGCLRVIEADALQRRKLTLEDIARVREYSADIYNVLDCDIEEQMSLLENIIDEANRDRNESNCRLLLFPSLLYLHDDLSGFDKKRRTLREIRGKFGSP